MDVLIHVGTVFGSSKQSIDSRSQKVEPYFRVISFVCLILYDILLNSSGDVIVFGISMLSVTWDGACPRWKLKVQFFFQSDTNPAKLAQLQQQFFQMTKNCCNLGDFAQTRQHRKPNREKDRKRLSGVDPLFSPIRAFLDMNQYFYVLENKKKIGRFWPSRT